MRYRSLAVLEEGSEEWEPVWPGRLAGRPGWPGTATVSTSALRCSCSVNHSSEPASHWWLDCSACTAADLAPISTPLGRC